MSDFSKICSNKNCDHCGIPQLLENFRKSKQGKDGFSPQCKDCVSKREKSLRLKNHKKYLLRQRRNRADKQSKNPNYFRDLSRKRRKDHPEETAALIARRDAERKAVKLKAIKDQFCLCPGCGKDKSYLKDEDLLIIFHKSHIHSSDCIKRKKNEGFFWSCRNCNVQEQRTRCGYWKSPGVFIELCKGKR